MESWRLIPLTDACGRWQMALDYWLFRQASAPVVRFYTWSDWTVSLGYHQRHWPDNWDRICWRGQPLRFVRRPTGGRGVLHGSDLTYSLVWPGIEGPRRQVYERVCQFLIEGWRSLGMELQFGTAGRGYHLQQNCFQVATTADLCLVDGTKLIGSAQAWHGSVLLQQGSMQVAPNLELQRQLFGTQTSLPPINYPAATIVAQLERAICRTFNVSLVAQPLSAQEQAAVAALQAEWQVSPARVQTAAHESVWRQSAP